MTELQNCESCPAIVETLYHSGAGEICIDCFNRELAILNILRIQNDRNTAPLRGAGDVFNTETRSFIELRAEIDADESVVEKDFAFQKALMERYLVLKDIVSNAPQQLAAVNYLLKNIGNAMREDIRARIKATDEKYMIALPNPVKTSLPKANKIDTALRFITELAKKKNCTIEEAKKLFALGKID